MDEMEKLWIKFLGLQMYGRMKEPMVNPLEKFKSNNYNGGFKVDSKKQVLHKLELIKGFANEIAVSCTCNVNVYRCSVDIDKLYDEIKDIVDNDSYRFFHMVGGKRVLKCGNMYVGMLDCTNEDSVYWFSFTNDVNKAMKFDLHQIEKILEVHPNMEAKEIRMVEM